ncbi:MAG: UTRA domain-containing protein, partial [Blautia hydrogenotrophica]
EELGIFPKKAIQSVEVSSLMEWEASLLGNESLNVSLLIHRQTFDADGMPLEYVESKYRSDKYKFYIELYDNE